MRGSVRLLVSSGLGLSSALGAQNVRGSLAISGGKGTDVAGVSSSAITVTPSFTTSSPTQSLTLSANGARFSNNAWSVSAGAAFQGRAGESAIAPTIDLGGSAAFSSYSFSYQLGEATPALEGRWGGFRLFGGAHLMAASMSRTLQPQSLGGVLPSSGQSSSTGVAAVGGVAINTIASDGELVSLSYRTEGGRIAGAWQTDNIVGASMGNANVALSGSIGARRLPDGTTGFGSGALAVGVGANLAVQLTAGRYAANRMLGMPAGDYLNLGAVIRLRAARSSLPKPSGVSAPAAGMTRLSIRAEDAATVEVAGEFNHWEFVSTRRASNGVWFADLRIPAGQYRYAFRINGKEWRIPAGATAAEDEFGGKSAWLTVDPTAGRSGRSETPTEERK